MAFRCGGAGHEVFCDGLDVEMWGTAEETGVDSRDEQRFWQVAQALVHERDGVGFRRSMV